MTHNPSPPDMWVEETTIMNNIILKTCPFCGGKASLSKTHSDRLQYYVKCGNSCCKVRPITWLYPTADKAVSAWNDRA